MYKKIKVLLLICTINQYLFSQDLINSNFTKKLLSEKKTLFLTSKVEKKSFNIAFSTNFFLNTSHSNLENLNGKFAPKGLSNYSSLLFIYQNDNLFFSIEPQIAMNEEYPVKLPEKVEPFKLSPVNLKGSTPNRLINTGFYINKWGIKLGYGNWNRWSGPAIHNSLMMSNNSDGIPNYFISSSQPIKLLKNLYFNYKYSIYDNEVLVTNGHIHQDMVNVFNELK